jgi:hypothetical protein
MGLRKAISGLGVPLSVFSVQFLPPFVMDHPLWFLWHDLPGRSRLPFWNSETN